MRNFYRVMLGRASAHAPECFEGGFIGTDFEITEDLTGKLPAEWRDFNKEFIPRFLQANPEKTKIGAGLACGALWTVSKGIGEGDIVICPDGSGTYHVAEVTSAYYFAPGENLPHRRRVRWMDQTIQRIEMSDELKRSTGSIGTVAKITKYAEELESLLSDVWSSPRSPIVSTDPEIEDPATFALEKHLEDFLVENWGQTLLGTDYCIYSEDGELVGQQYSTDAGPIDILAISKDGKRILVVELKRGRASDTVVGQTLRYMGYVREQIAEPEQDVEGVIIALEDDQKLRWALVSVPSVTFYRYRIDFHLVPA